MNLGFDRGTELDDPDGKLQGTGKLIRHIRLNSLTEIRDESVTQLIAQAVAQGRKMAEQKGVLEEAIVVVKRCKK